MTYVAKVRGWGDGSLVMWVSNIREHRRTVLKNIRTINTPLLQCYLYNHVGRWSVLCGDLLGSGD